ncbi:looped-hinge helix DNA binding domain-containing protein, AbrB family [Methanosarcina thermophila]|jgi:AbrB family looped-hinge helix DNA binding protein|uniref:Looped-hinge helix DNA binding domain-containing protein, AbrB family n=2 Tax=Methanosarcina thermophila TaxID=2210 RepID=A0A1I7AUE3_METTE|nr:looped-hinge helix DNA binding domain-containing protein, AbrB family [Methanosarcina thermophila]
MYRHMAEMRINRDKNNRTSIYLPAFLRDKFNLQNGSLVDIDTDGKNIIITPKNKNGV